MKLEFIGRTSISTNLVSERGEKLLQGIIIIEKKKRLLMRHTPEMVDSRYVLLVLLWWELSDPLWLWVSCVFWWSRSIRGRYTMGCEGGPWSGDRVLQVSSSLSSSCVRELGRCFPAYLRPLLDDISICRAFSSTSLFILRPLLWLRLLTPSLWSSAEVWGLSTPSTVLLMRYVIEQRY